MSLDNSIKKLGTHNTWVKCSKSCALYTVVEALKKRKPTRK